jgi:hypothetical protein
MKKKVFLHYLDRKEGKDVDVVGYFEIVEEGSNFVIIKTSKNIVRIPYTRIVKMKGGHKYKF